MPCMGPDCDYAKEKGRKVGEKILTDLINEHKIWEPIYPWQQERWDQAKENFIKAVEELFVEDACNSF